jgi:hypothetical protein
VVVEIGIWLVTNCFARSGGRSLLSDWPLKSPVLKAGFFALYRIGDVLIS